LARTVQEIAVVDFKLTGAHRRQDKNERILQELQSRQAALARDVEKASKNVETKKQKLQKMTDHSNAARDKLKEGDKALTLVRIIYPTSVEVDRLFNTGPSISTVVG